MFKLIFAAAALGALWYTNPPLERFKDAMSQQIEEDRSAMRAGVGFVRDIFGITRLKQATGASANHACRLNLYVASLFVLNHSSAAESSEPTALGLGIAGQVYVKGLQEEGIFKTLAESLGAVQCEKFLIN